MRLPLHATGGMALDTCGRCAQPFPHVDDAETERVVCEPCRDALWRDERGLAREGDAIA